MRAAELSDWMSELFPQGEARKSQLVELARMVREPVPSLSARSGVDSFSAGDIQFSDTSLVRVRQKPWKRRRVVASAVAILAVLAVLAVGATRSGHDVEAEASAAQPMKLATPGPAPEAVADEPSEPVVNEDAHPVEPEAQANAPKRRRSSSTAKSGPGTIDLVTRGGWADVYKGKQALGTTPRRITLPAGRHKLTLKPFGDGKPKTVFVTVKANKTRNVSIRLD